MMKSEFSGNILEAREAEDCIRATRKYTKGVFRRSVQQLIQGEELPSKVIVEYYEVYPFTDLSWDMPAGKAMDWLWGDVPHLDVHFKYNYQTNKGWMVIYGGNGALKELCRGIPGLEAALNKMNGTK